MDVLDLHWYPEAQGTRRARITENRQHRGRGGRPRASAAFAVGPDVHRNQLDHQLLQRRARSNCSRTCSATSTISSRARRSPSPNTTTARAITTRAESPRPIFSAFSAARACLPPTGGTSATARSFVECRVQHVSELRRRGRAVRRHLGVPEHEQHRQLGRVRQRRLDRSQSDGRRGDQSHGEARRRRASP